ncbi:rhodanese-like domain-containing protein [Asticcacaulis sp. AND118]|uniref:rhodanese-like domain-containing protein n=1 Tax=Asticcacaulis sp. AND118 TaxID=2840468 RepID=UPI001CFF5697|nr:rhodanese-like domain-containing protein [Asticcacaulis sp. AND118]UDF04676.1 rhodanese-like domain-containing protein [Asticcacaulis sp. AND118]
MKSVDAHTLKRWLELGEAVLIDVREPSEHAAERIEGAHLVPLTDIGRTPLPEHEGKALVIHCLRGGRGQTACERLKRDWPDMDIFNLEGGIGAWQAAGLPTLRPAHRRLLPLDRQTQLAIGIGLLISTLLALLVHPLFVLVAGFFGAGLTFAGLTGICGLARLLAVMPWNRATSPI